jgi:hypothetical protein
MTMTTTTTIRDASARQLEQWAARARSRERHYLARVDEHASQGHGARADAAMRLALSARRMAEAVAAEQSRRGERCQHGWRGPWNARPCGCTTTTTTTTGEPS